MTDWIRATTDQLAADGFIAIAPDFLSGKGPEGGEVAPDQARGMVSKLAKEEVVAKLNAARDYGAKLPASNGKTATVGFCWGGSMSFLYAAQQPDLNAAVIFYGTGPMKDQKPDEEQLARIKAPVLGLYGGNDARVTSTVDGTTKAMKKLEKKFDARVFDGAGHGFMRQHAPKDSDANRKAATEAWPLVVEFLRGSTK
jgi:carboxymethylenebutenolidase